jgi:hypothetical protein
MSFDLLTKPSSAGVPLTTKGDILTFGTGLAALALGSSGQALTADSAQPLGIKWSTPALSGSPNLGVTAVTGNITLDATNDLVLTNGSGGTFTVTLPDAANNTGKVYYLKRTDNTPTKPVKIATTSSQTVDGIVTNYLNTSGESWIVESNGANWLTQKHKTVTAWAAESGLTFTGLGSISNSNFFWRRNGDTYEVRGTCTIGTATAVVAKVTLPYTMDAAKFANVNGVVVGFCFETTAGSNNIATSTNATYAFYDGSDTSNLYFAKSTTSGAFDKNTGSGAFTSSQTMILNFSVPISLWGG